MKIRKCCSSIFMIFFYFSALSQSSEIDSLSSAWQNPNLNDSLRMEALGKLIIKYIDEYPDTAIFLSQKMRSEGQRNEDLRTEARALYRLGLVYERFGKIDSAEFFHERSLELRLQSGDKSLIGTGYNAIAGVFYQRHNYDSAIHYFNKGLEIYKEINDPKAISNSLNNLGVCHYQMGEIRKCIEYYGQSLNIDKALGNKGGEAAMYSNIGMLYSRVGELNKALEYQRLAIKIYNEDSTLQGAIRAFHAWAAAESDAGNYDAALRGFTKGYRMSKRGRQNAQVIEALAGRALVYTRMGKNHLAQKDYEEVLALGGKSSNIYANLGSLYFDLGELKKAELYSKKALAHNGHGTIGERHDKGVAYFTLYEVYKAQENYPLALKMHEIQQQLKDSLVNSENQNSLLQKEQEYETKFITDSLQLVSANQAALAAQEIKYQKTRNRLIAFGGISIVVLLALFLFYYFYLIEKRKQTQRQLAEAQLKQQLEENRMKAVKAQFKPHFLANVQVAIQNYMEQGNAAKASEYLDSYSGMLRGVLESSDKPAVTLAQELNTLKQYMELHKLLLVHPFTYKINVGPGIDPGRLKVPSLLLQPIVENAIKHGITPMDKGGHLTIAIVKQDGQVKITVEDNGIGQAVRLPPKNDGKNASFGLRFIREQLDMAERKTGKKCSMSIEGKKANSQGTRVTVIIPDSL